MLATDLLPTADQAVQFALMMHSGLPPYDALGYFVEDMHPDAQRDLSVRWSRDKRVKAELDKLRGGKWETLKPDERIRIALDKTYTEMAVTLMKYNLVELNNPASLAKMNTCRVALEQKLAGMAGQMTEVSKFWDDLSSGKVVLPDSPGKGSSVPKSGTSSPNPMMLVNPKES